jgi:multiple antibiotic resistance protein
MIDFQQQASLFIRAFIQMAIAIDALGLVPLYLAMIDHVPEENRNSVLKNSLLAGLAIGILFLFLGKIILNLLGIVISDFEIAGGIILMLIGVLDLTSEEKTQRKPSETWGVVPLGIPLIVGPATISVLFLLIAQVGYLMTLLAFVANLLLAGLIFRHAPNISLLLGKDGIKAISKVTMLLLIAIGIRMIRLGIMDSFFKH